MDSNGNRRADRFYPDGYVGLEQAALIVAKRVDAGIWKSETFLGGEAAYWAALGYNIPAKFISSSLWAKFKDSDPDSRSQVHSRVNSYLNAQRMLRSWLFSGDLVGSYVDPTGNWGWILKEGWGTPAGGEILDNGTAVLEGDWLQVVLLQENDIYRMLDKSNFNDKKYSNSDASGESPAGKDAISAPSSQIYRTTDEIEQAYKDRLKNWPADERPPTEADDWAFLKTLWPAITRERTREIRSALAPDEWKKSGRPRRS